MHENTDRASALLADVDDLISRRIDERLPTARAALPGLEAPGHIPGFDKDEAKKFSLVRAAKAAMSTNLRSVERECGFEIEACRALRDALGEDNIVTRTLSGAAGESGGFLIPSIVSSELLTAVIERSILGQMKVRRITAEKGELIFNKASNSVAYWVDSELPESITESDLTFTQIRLSPRALACLSSFTYLMLTQSDPAVEQVLRMQMEKRLSQQLDISFLLGTGAQSQPRGIYQHPVCSTRTVDWSGLVLGPTTAQNCTTLLHRMVSKIREDSADFESVSFFGEPRTAEAFEIAQDKQGRPVFESAANTAASSTLLGRPFGITAALKNATRTQCRFGVMDPSSALVCSWGTLAFATSNSAGANDFAQGVSKLRVIGLFDHAVLEPLGTVLAAGFDDADVVNS
jgi:HK97 family phage major capsid protein